jgi:AraC family ethanolamine operon transcriptional activator
MSGAAPGGSDLNAWSKSASDVDQLNESTLFDVRFTQLSRGRLEERADYVEADGMVFYRQRWSRQMLAHGAVPAGYFMLGTSRSPARGSNWCGHQVGLSRLACAASSAGVDFTTPDDVTNTVALVHEETLRRYLGDEPAAPATGYSLECERHTVDGFEKAVQDMIGGCPAHTNARLDFDRLEAVKSRTLALLARSLGERPDAVGCTSDVSRWKTVYRTRDYLASVDGPVAIGTVAAAVGVSQRALEFAFQTTLNITPLRFQRWQRLNGVYRELCAADLDSSLTVTDIATRWGFTELGRFSVEYRRLFGERPSDTLRASGRNPRLVYHQGAPLTLEPAPAQPPWLTPFDTGLPA